MHFLFRLDLSINVGVEFFLKFWIMQLNKESLLGQFGNFASTWSNDRSSYKWKPGDFGATRVPRLRTARRSRFPIWVHASLNPPPPVSNPLLLLDPAKAATPLASARNPCSIPVLSPHGISLPGCARAGTPDSGSSIRVRRRSICRWYGNQHALIFPAWMGVFFFSYVWKWVDFRWNSGGAAWGASDWGTEISSDRCGEDFER